MQIPDDYKLSSIDLYVSRASFQNASFEQFKVANDRLFAECGRIAGGRQFAQYQGIAKLSEDDVNVLRSAAFQLAQFEKQHTLNLDQPGQSDSMFDPGQYILTLESKDGKSQIKTTLDSVTVPNKSSTKLLYELADRIRLVAMERAPSATLCGNRSFFDLGGKKSQG